MKNAGLFSTLFLDEIRDALDTSDDAQGRLVTLSQSWQRRDAASTDALWRSFIKAALGNLGFVVKDTAFAHGLYGLFEDYSFENCIALLYAVEPGGNLDDESVGRFWPAKLITALRERKLNWGILTDGAKWRLYSTKSAKPYEDHVELDLGTALGAVGTSDSDVETTYALFERFFHVDSFLPRDRDGYDTEKVAQLKALGLKAKRQKRQEASAGEEEVAEGDERVEDSAEREAGIYLCRLDLDGEVSEAILEARVKEPLLAQVDNVLRYICNGFIADTPRTGAAYTEEERREVFESSVKLLYRCLFLFYAEARELLPSEDRHREIYAPHSINTLCREARKFRWNERDDTAGYDLWQQLKGLVQAVNEGDPTYGVMGYNGDLFDDDQELFLGQHRLRNDFLAHALYWLAFVDPAGGERDDEDDIPYEDLEVRHLGEMYESILEFKVRLADTDYLRRRSKNGWQTLPAAGQKTQDGDIRIKAGDIFFGETALERKQSGSYYTPESLVRFLVGKAVIAPLRERWESGNRDRFNAFVEQTRTGYDDAAKRGALRSAQELVNQFVRREVLTYKVCDPAMGSGHFLVAAANLMADFVVELLAGIEPLPGVASEKTGAPNHWRRLITRHCLYGADFNPLAVNLAKLALWLNCFAREHKLTFLDLHLRAGNSLIGLRDLASLRQIPERRKDTRRDRNEAEEAAQELPLGLGDELTAQLGRAASAVTAILDFAEDDTDRQREAFEEASRALHEAFSPLADLHTAYLMDASLRPADYARLLGHFAAGKTKDELWPDLRETWERVCTIRIRHHFFHWPLEFPDVFGGQANRGFSATVGNPPWDVLEPHTLEFYAEYDPNFRALERSASAKRIKELHAQHSTLDAKWASYEALFSEASAWFKEPIAYDTLTKGKTDLYKAFLERFFQVLSEGGRLGVLCPSSIYTDDGATPLRQVLFGQAAIDCLYCVSNERYIFPNVHHAFRIVVLCAQKGGVTTAIKASFAIDVRQSVSLQELDGAFARWESRPLRIPIEDIRRFSNGALSLMEFHSQEHVDVATAIYGHHPLLADRQAASWNAVLSQEYNMTSDRGLFNESHDGYPLYEGKMVAAFDHRYAGPTYWMKTDIARSEELTSYWRELRRRRRKPDRLDHEMYRVAYRRIASSTNERAFLSAVLPPKVACPHTMFVVRRLVPHETTGEPVESITAAQSLFLCSAFNSFVCDFTIRLKITTGLDMHFVYSLPVPRLGSGDAKDATYFWPVVARALRLICTTDEYAALWTEVFPQLPAATLTALCTVPAAYGPAHEQALRERLFTSAAALTADWTPACGLHDRKPDRRDDGDRAQTRAELDALIAHLYGLTKAEFAYILDTFPVLRKKEVKAFGEYQSKRKALEEYDRFVP
jgi:Eco57I restriction-modification methylase